MVEQATGALEQGHFGRDEQPTIAALVAEISQQPLDNLSRQIHVRNNQNRITPCRQLPQQFVVSVVASQSFGLQGYVEIEQRCCIRPAPCREQSVAQDFSVMTGALLLSRKLLVQRMKRPQRRTLALPLALVQPGRNSCKHEVRMILAQQQRIEDVEREYIRGLGPDMLGGRRPGVNLFHAKSLISRA